MVATVRLNDELEELLNSISKRFHKKKSDVIREAIRFYAQDLQKNQKTRLQKAMSKTMKEDYKVYKELEDGLSDGL
ncbi:ribbon-helix-helix protein, CopG family [Sulfurimonas sp.]|uniref:ribbon-helix-helix protein, CopG family n=1 Tax=Sulfurimonas sp. TaxID=2022749 RepID=UPI0026315510|nr:ribbon-helix-helix protein, CopG family [Sulfurimonas sp.]